MYRVRLREDYRWPTATINGREFTKIPIELQETDVTEEIRNSPLLVVEEVDSEVVEATEAAQVLAEQEGLLLGGVTGTGTGGRVTKKDVERVLRMEEMDG